MSVATVVACAAGDRPGHDGFGAHLALAAAVRSGPRRPSRGAGAGAHHVLCLCVLDCRRNQCVVGGGERSLCSPVTRPSQRILPAWSGACTRAPVRPSVLRVSCSGGRDKDWEPFYSELNTTWMQPVYRSLACASGLRVSVQRSGRHCVWHVMNGLGMHVCPTSGRACSFPVPTQAAAVLRGTHAQEFH